MDYIEALCAVYGRVETLPDLMYKFEHTLGKLTWSSLKEFCRAPDPTTQSYYGCYSKGHRWSPTFFELMKLARKEEAFLEEKNQGSREPMKVN